MGCNPETEINYYKTNHVYHYSTSLISSCYCIILHQCIASWYFTMLLHHIAPWYCTMLQQNRIKQVQNRINQNHLSKFQYKINLLQPTESSSSILYQTHKPKKISMEYIN